MQARTSLYFVTLIWVTSSSNLICRKAVAEALILINGVVTADRIDATTVSVRDQHGQVLLIPRGKLTKGDSLLIGTRIQVRFTKQELLKLKSLHKGR